MAIPESKPSVRLAVRTQIAKSVIEETIRSTGCFRLHETNGKGAPEVVFYEIGKDIDRDFELIEMLIESRSTNEVFIVVQQADPDILMKAMRSGVKEVFLIPIDEHEVKIALDKFIKRREFNVRETEKPQLGKIIGIIGCKGGVGTTTIAVNLATAMIEAATIQSVALLDMNMIFGDIPLFLSLKPTHHWGEVMTNIDRLDATFLKSVLLEYQSGLHVLASPSYLNGDKPATPEAVAKLIGLFQRMFEFVIIDMGQSLTPICLKILEASDEIFLVSLLNLACVSSASKLLKSFSNTGMVSQDKVRIIMNRRNSTTELPQSDAEKSLGKEIFWAIPNDFKTTMSAINNGRPLTDIASKAAVTRSIIDLTNNIISNEAKGEQKNGTKTKRWGFLRR
jgi:pilus assembly protein CpaE